MRSAVRALWAAALIFSLAIFLVPDGFYWRDAPEFALQAAFLDIAHPPGFPFYGQLANLFALAPFGPLTFRVNAFSLLLGCALATTAGSLAFAIARMRFGLDRGAAAAIGAAGAVMLCSSGAFVRQTFTAEVYHLNAVLLLSCVLLVYHFSEKRDARLLVLSAFAAGLTLANHPSAAFSFALFFPLLAAVELRRVLRVFPAALLFGALGLLVYLYLPARAGADLALDTGSPSSPRRLALHLTDTRDALLRNSGAVSDRDRIVRPQRLDIERATFLRDARRVGKEIPAWALVLAVIGAAALIRRSVLIAGALVSVAAGNWLFFRGWDPDPWIPLLAATAVCAAAGAALLCALVPRRARTAAALGLLLLTTGTAPLPRAAQALTAIGEERGPHVAAEALLRELPYGAPLLVEPSWFLVKALRDLEGYRHDAVLVYQPSLVFPELFTPVALETAPGGAFISSERDAQIDEPYLEELKRFLDRVSPLSAIHVEPSILTNEYLSFVAQAVPSGDVVLVRGEPAEIDPRFGPAMVGRLDAILGASAAGRADAWHYVQTVANGAAGLLQAMGAPELAAALLESSCALGGTELRCGLESLNNLAVLLINAGRPADAAEILRALLPVAGDREPVIRRNLALAEAPEPAENNPSN